MPRIERTAEVVWEGNVARGIGAISAGTGAFTGLEFSLPTRIGAAEGKTSPEELLAAAHGGCITMSLASELTQAGTPPGRLDVTCLIVMDEVEGKGHQIVASHVEMVATAEGADADVAPGRRRQGRRGLPVLNSAAECRRRDRRLRAARLVELAELVRARRTHKDFGSEPVSRETLLELLDLARFAPNHHLTQPWRFRVLGPDALARLKAGRRREGGGEARPRADARRRLRRARRRSRRGRGGHLRDRLGDHARAARRDRARHRVVLAHARPPADDPRPRGGRRPARRARPRPAPPRPCGARARSARARAGRELRAVPPVAAPWSTGGFPDSRGGGAERSSSRSFALEES